MAYKNPVSNLISGLHSSIKDIFADGQKPIRSKTEKPDPKDVQKQYPFSESIEKRILWLLEYYYREGTFEKVQFARKWMRNALIYQGYHELEWSEINVAWDVILQDSGDYAFPNNYYRTLIHHGIRAYVQNEPLIEPMPANDDAEAQGATKAARGALEIIKKTVHYDYLRVLEAMNLRLFGNSFRYSYFSKDPRFGYVSSPVHKDQDVLLSHGGSVCPQCGTMEGKFDQCPACGSPITQHTPPVVATLPGIVGSVKYPRGEVMTEIVSPFEMYVRSSSLDIWHAPFVVRNRVVDRLALQANYQDTLLAPKGDEGGGEAYSTGGDLGLIYLQSLADLPGDPTQYAAWYERATASAKALLVEGWIRPSLYFFDRELTKECPDGLYGGKTGDTLLEARNAQIEDHWTHYVFQPVPGRFWGDGDDDIIPSQLKLDETDRLILRNQGYNSAPLLAIDSQRVDKNEILNDPSTIIEVKPAGRPVSDAIHNLQSQPLSQESWQWRSAHLSDMYFHSKISPSAVGMHQPGVNSFGGQESMAAKSDASMTPQLILWKTADELWAIQVLKLAADNWLDERINAVMGIDGRWEFQKLKGASLALDKVKIVTRVLPIDPTQQDAMSQAVASGLLDPKDPRVKRRGMELFHLPEELDETYQDQKAQWEEIEQMKQNGQQVQPVLIMDNDAVHIDICRRYYNSDEARANPRVRMLVQQHAQLHMMNMARTQMMMGAVQGAGAQGHQQVNPQAQPGGPKQPEGQNEPAQGGKHGGQVPPNPVTRQQRAVKGQAAKPHRPQPPSGNQFHRQQLT